MNVAVLAPDVNEKIAALAAQVKAQLILHDSAFDRTDSVTTHLDDAVDARTRKDRIDLLGDPARYAEIVWAQEQLGLVDTIWSGEPVDVLDRFRIYVYWGTQIYNIGGRPNFAEAAADFRAALRQRDTPLGVATKLRTDGSFVSGEWEYEVRVEQVETTFRLIDKQNNEYRHEAAITCTVAGAPI